MRRLAILICALSLLPMSLTAAVDEKAAEAESYRLYVPYSKLDGLTGDQEHQIGAIEWEYREKIRRMNEEKHEKIAALLTDDQKAVLAEMAEARRERNRERARQYRERKRAEAEAEAEVNE